MRHVLASTVLAVALAWPAIARAQLSLPRINDVDFSLQEGVLLAGGQFQAKAGHYGLGWELLFYAGKPSARLSAWRMELALGYSQLWGLSLRDPQFDFRGYVRTLPSVSAYFFHDGADPVVLPFFGVGSGYTKLSGDVYDAQSTAYSVRGDTIELSATAGALFRPGIYVDVSLRGRYFPNLEYTPLNGQRTTPDVLPRAAGISVLLVELGYQFTVERPPE